MNHAEVSIKETILTAEREVQEREEALQESRQRLEAVKAEQKKIAAFNQRAAAIISGKPDDYFGRMARKTSVQDLLNFFHGGIITSVLNPNITRGSLADAIAMMAASSESVEA